MKGEDSLKALEKLREIFLELLESLLDFTSPEKVILFLFEKIRNVLPVSFISLLIVDGKEVKLISASHFPYKELEPVVLDKLNSLGVRIFKENLNTFVSDGNGRFSPEEITLIPLFVDVRDVSFYLLVPTGSLTDLTFVSFLLAISAFIYLSCIESRSPVSFIPGFLGREFIIDVANRLVKGNRNVVAVVVDINDLGFINLKYGNLVGNKVIALVSNVFRNLLKEFSPAFVCGYLGSGQFLFVCEEDANGKSVKQKCLDALKGKLNVVVTPENFSVSVSVAVLNLGRLVSKDVSVEKVVFMAIEKLKKAGKSALLVVEDVSDLEEEFSRKFDKFLVVKSKILNREIYPVFQPIYSISDLKVVGYELLSRFKENGELKSVYVYADVLDRLDLWQELDKVVLSSLLSWKSSVKKLQGKKLFVNLSGKFLSKEKNREFLLELSDKLVGADIVFEITEREYVEDMESVVSVMRTLKKKGIEIAIDDFASGFSGFDYVKRLNPDYIKLDGGLIKSISSSYEDQVIVSAVKYICEKLNIKLLAEWIEDEKILDILKKMGVELGQGYYLSPPLELLGR